MKKIIIVFILSITVLQTKAQGLTIADLRRYNEMSFENFSTEVKEKLGYGYNDQTEFDGAVMKEYSRFSNDITYTLSKSMHTADPKENYVSYSVTNKQEYKALLQAAIKEGYKASGKGKIPGGEIYTDYKLKGWEIRFVQPSPEKENDDMIRSYTLIVFK